jgi:hypothetical protein
MQDMIVPKKKIRFKVWSYFALKFFVWSTRLQAKADILLISGGDPAKLKGKVTAALKSSRFSTQYVPYGKPTTEYAINNLKESVKKHGEMKGNTYEEGRKSGGGLVPAKPGYFQMTDDVSQEKKKELEKLNQSTKITVTTEPHIVANVPKNNQQNDNAAKSRNFYYKRKKQKFNKNKNKGNVQNQ